MENSEFPQTRLSKISNKIGWILSPLILICLIAFTIFYAEGLQVDFDSGEIERKSSVDIRALKNGELSINEAVVGKTPGVFDITSEKLTNLKIIKEGRTDWNKLLKPEPGLVQTYQPILYPKEMDFTDEQFNVKEIYPVHGTNFFFYEKEENNKILIYKYSVTKQLFSTSIQNVLFADITSFVHPDPTKTPSEKDYTILPGNNGLNILVISYNQKAAIYTERGVSIQLSNIQPKKTDAFYWSPNDAYVIYKAGNEIYSIQVINGRVIVVYKPTTNNDEIDIEFLLDTTFVYKRKSENFTDLIQNSYESGNEQKLDIPNVEGIRKDNLVKAYNLINQENTILIQTNKNIYAYNTISFDFRKFNVYENEKVVFIDTPNRIVLTNNSLNTSQFVLTDLEQNEKKVFTVENKGTQTLTKVTSFNNAENLILSYPDTLQLIDTDGANRRSISTFTQPELALAMKQDNSVFLIVMNQTVPPGAAAAQVAQSETVTAKVYVERFEN